jgi:hypothetical protein
VPTDYTRRGRPTVLLVIDDVQALPKATYLDFGGGGLGIGEHQEVVQDLKHDGRNEILMSYALEPFTSAVLPTPYLEHIYVYQNGELVQKDREFVDCYRNTVLPGLREDLDTMSRQPPATNASQFEQEVYRKSLHAKQKEIDALRKLLSRS